MIVFSKGFFWNPRVAIDCVESTMVGAHIQSSDSDPFFKKKLQQLWRAGKDKKRMESDV